jgi:hypothetical protein
MRVTKLKKPLVRRIGRDMYVELSVDGVRYWGKGTRRLRRSLWATHERVARKASVCVGTDAALSAAEWERPLRAVGIRKTKEVKKCSVSQGELASESGSSPATK